MSARQLLQYEKNRNGRIKSKFYAQTFQKRRKHLHVTYNAFLQRNEGRKAEL